MFLLLLFVVFFLIDYEKEQKEGIIPRFVNEDIADSFLECFGPEKF